MWFFITNAKNGGVIFKYTTPTGQWYNGVWGGAKDEFVIRYSGNGLTIKPDGNAALTGPFAQNSDESLKEDNVEDVDLNERINVLEILMRKPIQEMIWMREIKD